MKNVEDDLSKKAGLREQEKERPSEIFYEFGEVICKYYLRSCLNLLPTNVLKFWRFLARFCFIKLLVNGCNASTWRQCDFISVYCTKFFNGFSSSFFLAIST